MELLGTTPVRISKECSPMSAEDQAVILSLIDAYIKKRRLEALAAS